MKCNVQIFVCECGITNNYFISLQAFKNKKYFIEVIKYIYITSTGNNYINTIFFLIDQNIHFIKKIILSLIKVNKIN